MKHIRLKSVGPVNGWYQVGLPLLLLVLPLLVQAQYIPISSHSAGRTLLTTGLDEIYNNQFGAAETTFVRLEKLTPNHPAVDLLRGVSLFYQWFLARTDTRLKQLCQQQLQRAAQEADNWLTGLKKAKNADQAEAMFVYFTAEVLQAKISHYEHETMSAIRHARNAYPFIQKGKTFQQQYPDFYLSTGLYNYYRDVYPEIHPFYKTVAWVMTAGDKKQGLSQLQQATKQALFVRTEAILYLTHLLTDYENRPADALPYLAQLVVTYPNNPYWRYKYAEALLNAHQLEAVPHEITQLMAARETVYHQMGMLLNARYALEKGQRSAAQTLASEVINSSVREESVRAYAYLVLARIATLQNQPKQARRYYKQMLDYAEYPILRNEAP